MLNLSQLHWCPHQQRRPLPAQPARPGNGLVTTCSKCWQSSLPASRTCFRGVPSFCSHGDCLFEEGLHTEICCFHFERQAGACTMLWYKGICLEANLTSDGSIGVPTFNPMLPRPVEAPPPSHKSGIPRQPSRQQAKQRKTSPRNQSSWHGSGLDFASLPDLQHHSSHLHWLASELEILFRHSWLSRKAKQEISALFSKETVTRLQAAAVLARLAVAPCVQNLDSPRRPLKEGFGELEHIHVYIYYIILYYIIL